MFKWIKSRGFTDRLYILNLFLTWLFTLYCMSITILQKVLSISDFSIIIYGLPVVWTELSVHTGFIVWKSKGENMAKWNKENIQM